MMNEKKRLSGKAWLKRLLSFVLALAMMVTMIPSSGTRTARADEGTILYLQPNENWKKDNARFAMYYFGNGDGWADMVDEDGDGIYEGVVPTGYTKVIFCRMNPGAAANNWENKWNQTVDLKVPTDGTNCYTVAEGTWDKGGGEWSVYPAEGETPEPEPAVTYTVAGVAALCGSNWDPADTNNVMTDNGDGTYTKVYENVAAGSYEFKVTDGTWNNSWGDNGQNYIFVVSNPCDVTVSFDSNTKKVTVTGEYVVKENGLEITSMHAVGNGSGNWLNGIDWDPTANAMTEISAGVYEITFEDVAEGTAYAFKFAANGAWTHSWGGGGAADEAVYNGQDIKLTVEYELADVTLTLDLTGYDHSTKTGAKYYVSVTEAVAEPAVEYYLVGYINGADYGCEADYATIGEYKFVSGQLTATFTQNSYVFVKTGDNLKWYMAESYCSASPAVLHDTSVNTAAGEKLFVPGNQEVTFTLAENSDGTLTLSYAAATEPQPEIPDGYNVVTVHFLKPESWGSIINAWVWDATGAIPGYEKYQTAWPGSPINASTGHPGWYDLVIATAQPQSFNFIFNDGSNQTADLNTGVVTGPTELWVIGKGEVLTEAPGEWSGDYDFTANIYFQKPDSWGDTINAWIWDANGAIPGYEQYQTTWPGASIGKDTVNSDWYVVSVTKPENDSFNFIFNDGNGNQTADLSTGILQVVTNLWVVDGTVRTEAPEGWADPSRTVHVPGTFPGPSWDAASNQMTYDSKLGLYVYTFENVPAAGYEYKIAINGSWDENYGANGEAGGQNIKVTVPETMDVTIWYNDKTHQSLNSVTYQMNAEISLTGKNIPEDTMLTDPDLTGLYSCTVELPAGTYDDLTITYGDFSVTFGPFTLGQDQEVTFTFDPSTYLASHNGSSVKVETDKIFYDSKDDNYKSPYGAVEEGEEVTFAIETGDDATSVSLIVPGQNPVAMEKDGVAVDGVQRWVCTTRFNKLGEYQYYFAISNGSDLVFYTDDNYNNYYKKGDYGTGTVRDQYNLFPYDIVVYKAGYETPDWMKDAVIYQIFPDRFFDADANNNMAQTNARGEVDYEFVDDWYMLPELPSQTDAPDYPIYALKGDGQWSNEIYGGDLKGIVEKIDYLKALGVNVIYLNPIFWSISNHRYDACDYMEIDPILGTLGDFEELVAVAEANDMHIILDGVFNHVSDDSVYFDRYYNFLGKSEKIGAYPYWAYVYDYMTETGVDQATAEAVAKTFFGENYGITDYSYTEWFAVQNKLRAGTVDKIGLRAGKEVYDYEGWWGYDSMPVVKSTNGSEFQTGNWAEEIIYNEDETSVSQYWITKGNNGWRLDVANEVSDETWQNFRDSVKALDSDAVIIGEIWADSTHYLMGDMYDSVMNYIFRDAIAGFARGYLINRDNKAEMWDANLTAAEAITILEILRERYPEEAFYAMMNLVGSHDTARILSYLDDIEDDRYQESLGMEYNFPTYENTSDRAKQLQYVVSFLQFTYAGAPTIYYGDEIGMVGADDPDDRRAFTWGQGNQELVEWYAKLAAIRAEYPALRTGSVEAFAPHDDVMGYVRRDGADTLIILVNRSSSERQIRLNLTELGVDADALVDMVKGKQRSAAYTVSDDIVTVTVPAYRGAILTENQKDVTVNYADLAPAYNNEWITVPYNVTVKGQDGLDDAVEYRYRGGMVVELDAGTYEGYTFVKWITNSENVTFENINSAETTFVMPAEDVTAIAIWRKNTTQKPSSQPEQGGNAPTGDNSPILLYGVTTLAALAVMAEAERRRRRV